MFRNTCVLGKLYAGLQSIFSLVAVVENVDVHPFLLIGVYLERIFVLAFENRTHYIACFWVQKYKIFPI